MIVAIANYCHPIRQVGKDFGLEMVHPVGCKKQCHRCPGRSSRATHPGDHDAAAQNLTKEAPNGTTARFLRDHDRQTATTKRLRKEASVGRRASTIDSFEYYEIALNHWQQRPPFLYHIESGLAQKHAQARWLHPREAKSSCELLSREEISFR